MRLKARTDGNHKLVTEALRARGWHVVDSSRLGHGFPDLVILKHGRTEFVEVKDGSKMPSARKLTEAEAKMHAAFQAAGVPVRVIASVEEALSL